VRCMSLLLARNCRSGMSAIRSLSGVNRTSHGRSILIALTPPKTSISLSPMDWQDLETFSFGDGPDLANRLLELVLSGTKCATCWAESQGLLSAEIGKLMVVLDGQGVPKAVLKTIELTKRRFDEVDEAFAYDEGEGDRSLQYWREAHTRYFTRLGRYAVRPRWGPPCSERRIEHS